MIVGNAQGPKMKGGEKSEREKEIIVIFYKVRLLGLWGGNLETSAMVNVS